MRVYQMMVSASLIFDQCIIRYWANPVYLPYSIVSVLCAYRIYGEKGFFKNVWGAVLTWLACTLTNTISASVITIFVYGGSAGVTGTSVLTVTLIAATKNIITSVLSTSMLENLIDKGITFFIAFILIQKIPKRFLSQYAADTDDEEDDED
ncbi:MAG: hypothetical protein ACLTJW_12920 [Blautia caecimuris]